MLVYPTKKKRTSKIFPLSYPFNAKKLIVIKYLFLSDQILLKLECGVDEYLCLPGIERKHIKANAKRGLEASIQCYCVQGFRGIAQYENGMFS